MRGRLSRIEELPTKTLPDQDWAWDRLRERQMMQTEIADELNKRLAKFGIEPLSRTGFNRFAILVMEGRKPRPSSRFVRTPREETLPQLKTELENLQDAVTRVLKVVNAL